MVVKARTAGSIMKANVGIINPAEDGVQIIEMVDPWMIRIQGKNGQKKDMGMNTPMEMDGNLGSSVEKEAFADAVKS